MKSWHFALIVIGAVLEIALMVPRSEPKPAPIGFTAYWHIGSFEECDAIEMTRMGESMRIKHTRFLGWFGHKKGGQLASKRYWHVEEFWVDKNHRRETMLLQTLVETKNPHTACNPVYEGLTFEQARSRLRAIDIGEPWSNCEIPTRAEAMKMPANLRPAIYSNEEVK